MKHEFSLVEAADYLGIKKSSLYRLTCTKQIAYSKQRKFVLFKKDDLDRYARSAGLVLFDEVQASSIVGFDQHTLRKLAEQGAIPAYTRGQDYYFSKGELLEFLRTQ